MSPKTVSTRRTALSATWLRPSRAALLAGAAATISFLLGVVGGWLVAAPMFETSDLEPAPSSAAAVAKNNLAVAIGMWGLGVATASLGALVMLALNGFVIGQLMSALLDSGDGDQLITGLLPHALLEVPGLVAIAIASALPAVALARHFLGQTDCVGTWRDTLLMTTTTFGIGIGLLIVASWVEDAISVVRPFER